MKTAIIFEGQGSQYPGMGKDLYDKSEIFKEVIDTAGRFTDFDLKDKMFNADADELAKTEIAQPVMAAFAYGVLSLLKDRDITWDYCAGLSLGEYSALAAAGVFDLETLIKVTAFRGRVMKEAGEGLDTKMIAVIGGDEDVIDDICKRVSEETGKFVAIANYNSKGQVVISGVREAADKAAGILKEKGCRCVPLKVSSAFHTKFMEPASKALHEFFQNDVTFSPMKTPVIFNVTGREAGDADIRSLLEKQVMSPVKMRQTIEYLRDVGVTKVMEVGPGKVVSGFIKKTAPEIECVSAEES